MDKEYIAYKPKGWVSSTVRGSKRSLMKALNLSEGEFDVALRNADIEEVSPIEIISSTPPF